MNGVGLQNLAEAADEDDEAEADMELQLAPMFPLGFAFMRISIGAGHHHPVEGRAALLVTDGGEEKTYEEQSGEEYCHRSPNRIRRAAFRN